MITWIKTEAGQFLNVTHIVTFEVDSLRGDGESCKCTLDAIVPKGDVVIRYAIAVFARAKEDSYAKNRASAEQAATFLLNQVIAASSASSGLIDISKMVPKAAEPSTVRINQV